MNERIGLEHLVDWRFHGRGGFFLPKKTRMGQTEPHHTRLGKIGQLGVGGEK